MKFRVAALFVVALVLSVISFAALAKARLGFGVSIATDGYFSTTLAEVKVASVQAGSPSEKAGLKVGDLIVELNGKPIKGANGLAVKKTLAGVEPGSHVVLKVLRAVQDVLVIDIVAGGAAE
jgi:S1-C subfamily serine protease